MFYLQQLEFIVSLEREAGQMHRKEEVPAHQAALRSGVGDLENGSS